MALCQSPVSTAGPSGKHLSTPPTSLTDLCFRVEKLEDIFQDLIDKELPDGETSAASSGFAVRLYPMKTSGILDFKGLRSYYYSRTHWITLFRRVSL